MGGGEGEIEIEGLCDVENTIFVAVGNNVKESKSTLLWALQSFAGKKICLLHVHEPARSVSLSKFVISIHELTDTHVYMCLLNLKQIQGTLFIVYWKFFFLKKIRLVWENLYFYGGLKIFEFVWNYASTMDGILVRDGNRNV